MVQDILAKINELKIKLQEIESLLNVDQKKQKILELEDKMQDKDFWNDQGNARMVSQEVSDLKEEIDELGDLNKEIVELLDITNQSIESDDESLEKDIKNKLEKLNKRFEKLEFKTLLSGQYDRNSAILAIHAGTGGTDAQDWAEMLERMYLRFCENKKFKVNILDRQTGNEAGIKSVIFEIQGSYAYGYLKSEAGVHRLVRISPFDAEKMRHTSFALTEVLPILEEVEGLELKEDDLEIDTFKSSGHGGQSVNTTDSAVRIRHKPTGISVSCQNERSQLQNKQTALKILKSRLKQYQETEQEEEKKKLRGEFSEAVWGNQARSYVLHPYKLVKDHRTEYETQNIGSVLDGDLDRFIESFLKWSIKKD
ncbi:MAG: peptide chain release factor 2 [Patescibacteria group bacterium]